MKTVAITGGIGSGKSTVTSYLSELGYTIIDADKMSREMTASGGKAMPYILEHFGPDYVNEDGSLNRAAMRDLVFRSSEAMRLLEEGTTRVVLEDIEKIKNELAEKGESFLFFDIPLLFEKHQEDKYDLVWVVTADYDIRSQRVMERDSIDRNIIDLIMDSQEEEEKKVSKADVIIYNNNSLENLKKTVDKVLSEL